MIISNALHVLLKMSTFLQENSKFHEILKKLEILFTYFGIFH